MTVQDQDETISGKTVLITGASSGFGLEFAKIFADDDFDLILTAKYADELAQAAKQIKATYKVNVIYKAFDLAVPGNTKKLFDWTKGKKKTVTYLVNNAGLGLYGKFADHDLKDEQELLNVNVNALSELCHYYIPGMIKNKGGRILNVASIAGLQPGPTFATYFASKAYVLLFSEALYYEYKSSNISITALCPGIADTNFFKRANMRKDSRMFQVYLMDPEIVAQSGYKAMMAGKRMVIPGYRNKGSVIGYRFLPRSVVTKLTHKLIDKAAK